MLNSISHPRHISNLHSPHHYHHHHHHNHQCTLSMDSGGLSSMHALHVIQQVPSLLQNGCRKPRSVITYFESIGFSKTHISKIISDQPKLLLADVEKTLKPKIQLFQDFGFSNSNIADLIASKPPILHRSVKTQIKPALDLITSFVNTVDDDLIKTIKRSDLLVRSSSNIKSIELNINVLRKHGVPDNCAFFILTRLPTLMSTPNVFERVVKRIVSLGSIKPETRNFSFAVVAMSGMKKPTWDSKINQLKGLGWSDEQIQLLWISFEISIPMVFNFS